MKSHIVIVSEESVYARHYKCGVGEVVDTMADRLRDFYDVTVITIGRRASGGTGRLMCLGVEGDEFYIEAAKLVNQIQPDLVHNFGRPDFIELLKVDCPKVLSFDRWEDSIAGQLEYVRKYDHVVTLSSEYANEMIAEHPEAAQWPLKGIINGIDGVLYSPVEDKARSRAKYYSQAGREDEGKKLIVYMGRLKEVKGIQDIIDSAEQIRSAGVDLVVYGTGDVDLMTRLVELHEDGILTYNPYMIDYLGMCEVIHAADFYLYPSLHEVCGLQPMKAAHMGCVPIVRPVGGMKQNFSEETAVLITDTVAEAVLRAVALSDEEYTAIQEKCMAEDWTWETRIRPWIELYGLSSESDVGGE